MREILYRAKRLDNGEWIEGYYAVKGKGTDLEKHFIVSSTFDSNTNAYPFYFTDIEVAPETVCQYTGLTDKNGRKIFEGDILRFVNYINNNEWLCSIEFLEGSFICRYIYEDGELGEYNHFTSWHEKVKWEVIGNIFDNPELIGDQP